MLGVLKKPLLFPLSMLQKFVKDPDVADSFVKNQEKHRIDDNEAINANYLMSRLADSLDLMLTTLTCSIKVP